MNSELRRSVALGAFMLILVILLVGFTPHFASFSNAQDIGLNATYIAIAGLGMLLLIIIGQIDVSVGAMLAICATVAGLASKAGLPVAGVVAISILVGLVLGALNGLLVTVFGVHAIIVTLGMLSIYRGTLIYLTGGSWIYDLPPSFNQISQGHMFGVPNPIIALAITFAVISFMLRNTVLGRSLFAVGSKESAARVAGINVNRVKFAAFAINGALVGLAAIIFASRFTVVQSNAGLGFELSVITVVVVGGASIFGGSGSALGVVLGAFLVSLTTTALVFLGISSFWEQAVLGAFVLVAVLGDRIKFIERFAALRVKSP
jgi:rhamnose transport system permease protein